MLHGTVEMNHVVIGEWQAEHIRDHNGFRDYHCKFWVRKEDGYVYEAEWDVWGHRRGDGAASLAAKILQQGNAKAKRRVPDGTG